MALRSPAVDVTRALIFGEDAGRDEEHINAWLTEEGEQKGKRKSMYVEEFEKMLRTVLWYERHLFTDEEFLCIGQYEQLSASAKYLLVRLCIRKIEKWHRLSSLKYESELGDTILTALRELCGTAKRKGKQPEVKVKVEEPEIIDLTMDDEDDQPVAGPSKQRLLSPELLPAPPARLEFLAEDSGEASLRELLECLSLAELKEVAVIMKVKHTTTRPIIIESLLGNSMRQGTLSFPVISPSTSKKRDKGQLRQTTLSFLNPPKKRTQEERLREIVLKTLVECVRINQRVFNLFRRINLVYFRSTQFEASLINAPILVRAKKRSYYAYKHVRTPYVWLNRQALLDYEEALQLSAQMDELLAGGNSFTSGGRPQSVASKTPARRSTTTSPNKSSLKNALNEDDKLREEPIEESPRIAAAKQIKTMLEKIYPKWQALLEAPPDVTRSKALERFDCGHIYTRIVCKASSVLGTLRDYDGELRVLRALLSQRRWRRGRRGRWYERSALIYHKHMGKDRFVLHKAMDFVLEGLKDDDTHMIYRVALERRLTVLEKKLAIPLEERHICQARLHKPEEVYIAGVRVDHRSTSVTLDSNLKVVNKPLFTQKLDKFVIGGVKQESPAPVKPEKSSGKSIWKGRDDEEITVEELALQHYENLGYKGFHCEGRIVTSLFGLLFWDIIFAPIEGAFETPYQAAPLDIAEDTFYTSRQDLADARLREITEGRGTQIVERFYDQHYERETMCVGVRWDLFERQDLLEITKCIGGPGLAAICRLLCEDYAGRCSGVPDLVIWSAEQEVCKFVEVKGPGDSLQENQKVWIDVLSRAEVPVLVCHVEEEGKQKALKAKKPKKEKVEKKASTVTPRKRKRPEPEHPGSDTEHEEDVSKSLESEDEESLALMHKKVKLAEDDVLPSLTAEDPPSPSIPLRYGVMSFTASSATASSSKSRTLSRSTSRNDLMIGTASPHKKPRIVPPSSP